MVNQAIAPSASVVGLVTVIATGLVIVHVIVRATIVVPSINMEK